jgi:hypothetical protein
MGTGVGRHAELAGELIEWWEDLCERRITSRVVLVEVPPGWGRSTALDHLAAAADRDDSPITLVIRVNGHELPDEIGLQAAVLQDCLAAARSRHRVAELLGLDRFGGAAQVGLGIGGLFISGPAAGVGFLLAGVAVGAAGKAWDESPSGQDGAVARAARAVAAKSAAVPVVVLIDDADCLDQDLAVTMIENLAARHDSHVLVIAAVNPGGELKKALVSRARQGITEGLVQVPDADPDIGYQSRTELVREQCPALPEVAVRRIARRSSTFTDVFAVCAAHRLAEIDEGMTEFEALEVADAVIRAQLKRPEPSSEAVIIAWAGGTLHTRQASRALEILGAGPRLDADGDVQRWEGLERIADPRSPRLTVHVAALAARDRRAMAAALLAEALPVAADPECGLIDRVVSARAAHRVRAELADRGQLARGHALGDPDSPSVALRGQEEGIGDAMAAKVRNALMHYLPLMKSENVKIRLHQTVLYNSIYHADGQLLINQHLYGIPAAHSPVYSFRQAESGEMTSSYLDSFERIWTSSCSAE